MIAENLIGFDQVEPLRAADILNKLRTVGLGDYDHPEAMRVIDLLSTDNIDVIGACGPEVLEVANQYVAGYVKDTAQEIKAGYINEINDSYPAVSDVTDPIPSMVAFVGNRSSAKHRDTFRNAYIATVGRSRQSLIGAIHSDTSIKQASKLTVSEDQLAERLRSESSSVQAEIVERIDPISTLLSERAALRQKRAGLWIGRRSRDRANSIQISQYSDQIGLELEKLASFLEQLQEISLAESAASYFFPGIESEIQDMMLPRYHQLTVNSIKRLHMALDVAHKEARVMNRGKFVVEAVDDDSLLPELIEPTIVPQAEAHVNNIREIELGEVPNSFPWSTNEHMSLSLLHDNKNKLLVCVALMPEAKKVKDKLRTKPNVTERLEAIENRIKAAELVGNNVENPAIKTARIGVYYGRKVFYYSIMGPNCPRVYYMRTTLQHHPEIAGAISDHNLSADTPLITLIAHTDKANQLAIYRGFGVGRQHARNKKVGSI